jgi:hypothetical protein
MSLKTILIKYNLKQYNDGYYPDSSITLSILYNLIKELLSLNSEELTNLTSADIKYGIKVCYIKNKKFIYPKHNPYEDGLTDIIKSFYNSDSNDWKNYNNILKDNLGWIRYQGCFSISNNKDLNVMINELQSIINNNSSLNQDTSIYPVIDYYNSNIIIKFADITKYYEI